MWWKKCTKGLWWKNKGAETDRKQEGEQEQVRELLIKAENMLHENRGWHFSLHMYQRMEEEWSRRELELRCRLVPETDEGGERREQTAAEPVNATEQRAKSEMEAKEQGLKKGTAEKETRIWEEKEEKVKVGLRSKEEEYEGTKASTEMKASLVAPCWLNTSQDLGLDSV